MFSWSVSKDQEEGTAVEKGSGSPVYRPIYFPVSGALQRRRRR